nr:MAG TPA: hypothetical protein [Caudoviricetes sp.]
MAAWQFLHSSFTRFTLLSRKGRGEFSFLCFLF